MVIRYRTIEEMIEKEWVISSDMVERKAFGDEKKLIWWQGRLNALAWCKEQLTLDKGVSNITQDPTQTSLKELQLSETAATEEPKHEQQDEQQEKTIGVCPICQKDVTDQQLFVENYDETYYHFSCFNYQKKQTGGLT